MTIHNLILGAGGVRGIAILGAYKELMNSKKLEFTELKRFAGVSIGSILAFLLSIHMPVKDICEMFHETPQPMPNIFQLFTNFGVETGESIVAFLQNIIESRGLSPDITFIEHFEHFGKELHIQSTNLNLMKGEIYSHHSHPDMKIVEAIRRSIGVPLFFVPAKDENGHLHIDGAVVGHDDLEKLFDPEETLSIMIRTRTWRRDHPFASFQEYVQHLMLMLWMQGQPHQEPSSHRIMIDTDDWRDGGQQLFGKHDPEVLQHMFNLGLWSIHQSHHQ